MKGGGQRYGYNIHVYPEKCGPYNGIEFINRAQNICPPSTAMQPTYMITTWMSKEIQ